MEEYKSRPFRLGYVLGRLVERLRRAQRKGELPQIEFVPEVEFEMKESPRVELLENTDADQVRAGRIYTLEIISAVFESANLDEITKGDSDLKEQYARTLVTRSPMPGALSFPAYAASTAYSAAILIEVLNDKCSSVDEARSILNEAINRADRHVFTPEEIESSRQRDLDES